jgi:acetoin:2,6-dichlorophenolindophenol oxidoreductase subunit alpha
VPEAHRLRDMVQTAQRRRDEQGQAISRDVFLTAYRWMLLARLSEEKYANLYRGGKIFGGVFTSKGQEALSVSVGLLLRKSDIFAPLSRDQ